MKLLLILSALVTFAGCAHVSEYNQGCRDGIQYVGVGSTDGSRAKICDGLEQARKAAKEVRQENRR